MAAPRVNPVPELGPDDVAALDAELRLRLGSGLESALADRDPVTWRAMGPTMRWTRRGVALLGLALPTFPGAKEALRYAGICERYRGALEARGVRALPGRLALSPGPGRISGWWVCHAPPEGQSLPTLLRRASQDEARVILESLVERLLTTIQPSLGLDGRLEAWAIRDGELWALTTGEPLLRDDAGRDLLDPEARLAWLPGISRPLLRAIDRAALDRCFHPRGALADLLVDVRALAGGRWRHELTEQVRCALHDPIDEAELGALERERQQQEALRDPLCRWMARLTR